MSTSIKDAPSMEASDELQHASVPTSAVTEAQLSEMARHVSIKQVATEGHTSGDETTSSDSGQQPMHLSIHALSMRIYPALTNASPRDPSSELLSDVKSSSERLPASSKDSHTELIQRLKQIFELDADEELTSSHPCWLFRSILLQGHLYIMSSHLCFYADLPLRQDKVLRAGILRKRTRRTHRFSKHWAILRGRALSWYESDRDPYFPQDQIDLRDIIEVREDVESDSNSSRLSTNLINASKGQSHHRFTISTSYRTFLFELDNADSRDAWVLSIRKAVFRAQNEGDSVRICIPLETILDVDSSNPNPSAGHTTKAEQKQGLQDVALVTIKVIQSIPGEVELTMDEYLFTNMADEELFRQHLREKLLTFAHSKQQQLGLVRATIGAAATSKPIPIPDPLKRSNSIKGSMTPTMPARTSYVASQNLHPLPIDLEAKLADAASADTFVGTPPTTSLLSNSVRTLRSSDAHGYPPSPPAGAPSHMSASTISSGSSFGERKWTVPQWLRLASNKVATNTTESAQAMLGRFPHRTVRETWSALPQSLMVTTSEEVEETLEQRNDLEASISKIDVEDLTSSLHSAYSILETEDAPEEEESFDEEILEQFQQCFALPDIEQLAYHTSTSLYRVLPVAGRLFVSTNFICFRSSRMASKTMGRTLMILPRSVVISVAKNNAVQYGRHGLVIIVRGHEELFFEFTSSQRRDQCISMIELRLDEGGSKNMPEVHYSHAGEHFASAAHETLFLTDAGIQPSQNISDSASSHQPSPSPVASSTSSFMPVKPRDDLLFTILTVGSRGDVQPYIALACGLQRDGHRVRIATHGEFGKWIESFGIEFREVGGDPAELMRICIENGTFTLAFVRESVTRFRGWLDELLESCWHACQGTDVVIESPSALAGIHIAEALQVPYFRGFTMPWSRTRAYPHAFAVPSRRAGGNYNYMSYVIFEQVLWRASAGQINAWRKRSMRLCPTNLHRMQQHKVPFLYNFSPSLVPKPLDWSDWIHVTGFWFLDHADETGDSTGSWRPPSDLVEFIAETRAQERKLVYIGWGSIVIADADIVLQTVVEAVRSSGVRAIISRGWSDRLRQDCGPALGKQASGVDEQSVGDAADVWQDIFTVQSVPHDWLFPQLDAACHHGGSGTLGASLRAGVPTLVRPFFGDQFFWASQVESLQIGANIGNPFTAETFSQALIMCTNDVRMKRNARALAQAIRKEDGVGNAIRAIYADWEYACGLIRRDGRLPDIDDARNKHEPAEVGDKTHASSVAEQVFLQIDDEDTRSLDEWSIVSEREEGIATASGAAEAAASVNTTATINAITTDD